jgi:hypothetical protein
MLPAPDVNELRTCRSASLPAMLGLGAPVETNL